MSKILNVIKYIFRIVLLIVLIIILYNFVWNINKNNTYDLEKDEQIAHNTKYTGVLFKDEKVLTAKETGYINYFVSDNNVVRNGGPVYAITTDANLLSDIDVTEKDIEYIREKINKVSETQNDLSIKNIYNSKSEINNAFKDIAIKNGLSLDIGDGIVEVGVSPMSGIVSFVTDGYETIDINDYNNKLVERIKNDAMNSFGNHKTDVINENDIVCKIVSNLNMNIAFDTSDDLSDKLGKNIKIKIKNINKTLDGTLYELSTNNNEKHYYISIIDYIANLVDLRTIDFEIIK